MLVVGRAYASGTMGGPCLQSVGQYHGQFRHVLNGVYVRVRMDLPLQFRLS